jgi:ADP-heptose:LPS heptosyltransferase
MREFVRKPNGWACIARMGGVGDNLIASSVLPGLKAKYGHVEVVTSEPQHVIFENNPYIDKLSVREQGDPGWGDGHSWQAWFQSRSKEYDFFANLSHSCETLRCFIKVQTPFWWPVEMRRKMANQSYLEAVHDICGVPYDQIAPNFFPTAAEADDVREAKAKVGPRAIAWVMTGTRIDKIYPYAEITIARIIKELGVPVIMLGAPGKDFELAKGIEREVKKHNGSVDGLFLALSPDPEKPSWPVRRILALAQQCDLVIGPDTGPMWAVAMKEMPKVMLLSHASPENITKHWRNTTTLTADPARVPCWPCHRLHDDPSTCVVAKDNFAADGVTPWGASCMADISVERLVSTVSSLLPPNHPS